MSRPAMPESETPETDAALKSVEEHSHAHSLIRCANVADVARSLERRLSLAQTEIKGHMRVEDDLRRDLERGFMEGAYARLKVLQAAEYELAGAQARIAELEKAIQRVVETDDFDDLELDDGLWTNSARRFLQAALKDRA